jgi:hypothetical protein
MGRSQGAVFLQTDNATQAIPTASGHGLRRSGDTGPILGHRVSPHDEAVGTKSEGNTLEDNIDTPVHGATCPKPILHQEIAEKQLDGEVLDSDGVKFVTHSCLFLSSCAPDISKRYMRSHRKLLFLLSTIVALIAIIIQYASETEVPHGSIGLIRPGWAQHRNEGWQYQWGDRGR